MAFGPYEVSVEDSDGLLSGLAWSGDTISFAFGNTPDDYPADYSRVNEPERGFQPLSEASREVFRMALAEIGAVVAVDIVEIGGAGAADIAIAGSSAPGIAYAYLPGDSVVSGDVWINPDEPFLWRLFDPSGGLVGTYDYTTALHELGHSLGLKHGHRTEDGVPPLPSRIDGQEYTIMTYRSYVGDQTTSFYNLRPNNYPQSLMMLDIAALQRLYGANHDWRAGDTVYAFSPASGTLMVDGVAVSEPVANVIFRTLWDGGGTDTLDLSGFDSDLLVDLRPGQGSDLDVGGTHQRAQLSADVDAPFHLYMSLLHDGDPRSLIENVIGGAGDDTLVGNAAANRMEGGSGTNAFWGGAGADLFAGLAADLAGDAIHDFSAEDRIALRGMTAPVAFSAASDDTALVTFGEADGLRLTGPAARGVFATTTEDDVVTIAAAGTDHVLLSPGADNFVARSPEARVVDGGAGADVLVGGGGDDVLVGGTGSDNLIGSAGDDLLIGGAGADYLVGGSGADVFRFAAADYAGGSHVDTIADFVPGEDALHFDGFGPDPVAGVFTVAAGAVLNLGAARLILLKGLSAEAAAQIVPEVAGPLPGLASTLEVTRLTDFDDRLTMAGQTTAQAIDAGAGDDVIVSGSGNDTIVGGPGSDLLVAGGGNDRIEGGAGSDDMVGGSGADAFVIRPGPAGEFSIDTIRDFEIGADSVHLLDFGFTDVGQLDLNPVGAGTVLTINPLQYLFFSELTDIDALTGADVFSFA